MCQLEELEESIQVTSGSFDEDNGEINDKITITYESNNGDIITTENDNNTTDIKLIFF